MKTWNEAVGELDPEVRPLTRALLCKAATDLDCMEHKYGFPPTPYDTIEEMIEIAVAADIFSLLYPSLMAADTLDASGAGTFPRDRILTFVCGIWFFTTVIPRLEEEGCPMDINRLASHLGSFLFMPYGEENIPGLIKIGIQYWKELGAQSPPALVEWHRAFSQMIFIHYEQFANDKVDLGDFDLDSNIGKMLGVFLCAGFTLPVS